MAPFLRLLRTLCGLLCGLLCAVPGRAVGPKLDIPRRSVSTTGQFIIYCDDLSMRLAVGSFAEETKTGVLALLGLRDEWKVPLVITILPKRAARPGQPPSEVRLGQTEAGLREELNVTLGDDPATTQFQQQVVSAILLEIAYRTRGVIAGQAYAPAPTWLVEGITRYLQTRETAADTDLFKSVISVNKLPALRDFLHERPPAADGVPATLYRAYALSLVEVLVDLPGAKGQLADFVQAIPESRGEPVADLRRAFPALGQDDATMEKWWTLSMAKLSASDRYRGLNLKDTVARLEPLLKVEIPLPAKEPKAKKAKGEAASTPAPAAEKVATKIFPLTAFPEYLKIKGSRNVLARRAAELLGLETLANPLLKPAIAQYRIAISDLSQGRRKGVAARLADGDRYRELVLKRLDAIADYLNWFEATQITTSSHLFDVYLREAKALEEPQNHAPTAITRYMDVLEQQLK